MITTILLDYGNVLAHPTSGNWFLTTQTRGIMGSDLFTKIQSAPEKAERAFAAAHRYLNENHLLYTVEEEILQFTEFFRLFLSEFGASYSEKLCTELGKDIVLNKNKVTFYDDIPYGLQRLKLKYSLSILSDTWPSLSDTITQKGIAHFFDHIIKSCDHNETKEGTKLFEIALSAIQAPPEQILFVDDSPANLANAEQCGLHCALMDRNRRSTAAPYPTVHDLEGVLTLAKTL